MSQYLNYQQDLLQTSNALWTAKEICQQPPTWLKAAEKIDNIRTDLDKWLAPILAKKDLRIILTGAGTSDYIGQSIAPHLSRQKKRIFEAISTTELVGTPNNYLLKEAPTLVISYGRSGNSPESVAAVNLADQVVDECYHLIITCNPEGELAKRKSINNNTFSVLMPEETLDQSFAMTSSFSSMLVSTLCIFTPDKTALDNAIVTSQHIIDNMTGQIKELSSAPYNRLVFLGAGGLGGMAKEAALKVLELTAGKVISYFESPLGFRHGPKSIVDHKTQIIIFRSSDEYTNNYDTDLINELLNDDIALGITVLDADFLQQPAIIADAWAGLPYIVFSQILAFYMSMNLNLTPDNPCPSGEVNRVVQGVTIHPLIS